MIEISRRSYFCAGHRLHNENLTKEENIEIYGCCNNQYGHGHNYWLDVTIRGEIDPRTGMVMNLEKLANIVDENIIKKIDHHNIDIDVDFMKGHISTAENITTQIWKILDDKIGSGLLYRVRLFENPENSVTLQRDML